MCQNKFDKNTHQFSISNDCTSKKEKAIHIFCLAMSTSRYDGVSKKIKFREYLIAAEFLCMLNLLWCCATTPTGVGKVSYIFVAKL